MANLFNVPLQSGYVSPPPQVAENPPLPGPVSPPAQQAATPGPSAHPRGTGAFLNVLGYFGNTSAAVFSHITGESAFQANFAPYRLEQREVDGRMKTLVAREDQVMSSAFPHLNSSRIRNRDYRVETDPEKANLRMAKGLERAEAQIDLGQSRFYGHHPIAETLGREGIIRDIRIHPELGKSDLEYQTLNERVTVAHMQGDRDSMEDEHLAASFRIKVGNETKTVQLQGVFDGHGGDKCARYLRKNLVSSIKAALQKEANINGRLDDINIYNACKIGMVNLSRSFAQTSGATANFSMVVDNKLVTVNTGDARAILVTPDGIRQISEDAKPESERYQKSIANRDGGIRADNQGTARVDGVLAVARAVGDHSLKGHISARPKVTIIALDEIAAAAGGKLDGCYVFHGCDGVFDVGSTRQVGSNIQQGLKAGKSMTQITAETVQSSFGTGSTDNISGMMVRLGEPSEID